jgi:ornithine--oxo-acid transaminase
LRVLDGEALVKRSERLGELLLELTTPLVERYEIVREVRGLGLMWAIELGPPSGAANLRLWNAVERAQPGLAAQLLTVPLFDRHRIFCQVAGHRMNVVKALPALVVEEAEIRRFAAALDAVLESATRLPRAFAELGFRLASRGVKARVS